MTANSLAIEIEAVKLTSGASFTRYNYECGIFQEWRRSTKDRLDLDVNES
jgi:hypothetical protein